MEQVALAAIAFVGTHFLLSHPFRRPLVDRLARATGTSGEGPFLLLYSLVATATLVWLALAYRAAPDTAPWWTVGDGLWAVATVLMLIASILLMGSLIGNPALPDPTGAPKPVPAARGVYAITRHPMMWAFAIWGVAHILVWPVAANVIVAVAIIILALVGAALQDRKKRQLQPDVWPEWQRRTSYLPFAAIAAARARLGGFRPHDWAGGIVIWLAASWAHLPLAGWAAGIWRWL